MNTYTQKKRLKNLLGLVVHVTILALGKQRKEDQGFKVILSLRIKGLRPVEKQEEAKVDFCLNHGQKEKSL